MGVLVTEREKVHVKCDMCGKEADFDPYLIDMEPEDYRELIAKQGHTCGSCQHWLDMTAYSDCGDYS